MLLFRARPLAFMVLSLVSTACSEAPTLTVEVMTGAETDTFSGEPPVERVRLEAVGPQGEVLASATSAPGSELSLGELTSESLARFEVYGFDAQGALRVRGRSLSVVLGGIESEVLPVFAQRVERWSRPPGQLEAVHHLGLSDVLAERFLMQVSGDGSSAPPGQVAYYDLLAWGGSEGPLLDEVPTTMAVMADGTTSLVITNEAAYFLDFRTNAKVDLLAPDGLSFLSVAGGRVVRGPDTTFIVGPTRDSDPSDQILVVARDLTLSAVRTTVPRLGAAATWVSDEGLVLTGGSAEGPGVEVVSFSTDAESYRSTARPYPADAIRGATAVQVDDGRTVWLLCGENADGSPVSQPRVLNLDTCVQDCSTTESPVSLPSLTECSAYQRPGGLIVIGQDHLSGETLALRILLETLVQEPLPFREPRYGASVVPTPTGQLAVMGGLSVEQEPVSSVELLFPSEEEATSP